MCCSIVFNRESIVLRVVFKVLHIVSLLASILANVDTILLASSVEIMGTGICPAFTGVGLPGLLVDFAVFILAVVVPVFIGVDVLVLGLFVGIAVLLLRRL